MKLTIIVEVYGAIYGPSCGSNSKRVIQLNLTPEQKQQLDINPSEKLIECWIEPDKYADS